MHTLSAIAESFRIKQWVKNLFVYAGIIFAKRAFDLQLLLSVTGAFFVLCLVSSATYIINDLVDRKRDQHHPVKCKRPLASGRLAPGTALTAALLTLAAALALAALLHPLLLLVAVSYFLLQLLYSFVLKHIVFLDVFAIAVSFILRVVAGAVVAGIFISSWLIICTLLISVFLGLGKRRHELHVLKDDAHRHRKVLQYYSPYLLDNVMNITAATTIVCYILYTTARETIDKFQTTGLIFTVPFVMYGIFRYLYLVHMKEQGGSPENMLLEDIPMLLNVALWIASAAVLIYF